MRNQIHILDLHYILLFCYNVFVLKNCQNLHIFTKKVTLCLDIVSLFLGWRWSGQNYQILLARSNRNRNTDWEELVTEFEKLTLQGFSNSHQIQYSECISICSSRFTHRKSIFSFSRVRSRSCISHLRNKRHTLNLPCSQLYLPSQVANPLQLWTSSSNNVETLLCQEQRSRPMVCRSDYQGFQLLQRISPQYPGQFVVCEWFLDAWHFVRMVWLIFNWEPLLVFCSAGCLSACGW